MTPTLQSMATMVLVVIALGAALWFVNRLQKGKINQSALLNARAQMMVGPRERVVLLEVGEHWILVGVSSGHVRALAVLPRDNEAIAAAAAAIPAPAQEFASLLARLHRTQQGNANHTPDSKKTNHSSDSNLS